MTNGTLSKTDLLDLVRSLASRERDERERALQQAIELSGSLGEMQADLVALLIALVASDADGALQRAHVAALVTPALVARLSETTLEHLHAMKVVPRDRWPRQSLDDVLRGWCGDVLSLRSAEWFMRELFARAPGVWVRVDALMGERTAVVPEPEGVRTLSVMWFAKSYAAPSCSVLFDGPDLFLGFLADDNKARLDQVT